MVLLFVMTNRSGKVFLYTYLSDTSPAPDKPGKFLYTPFWRKRSIYAHLSGAGEVFIYTYLVPEKYLYTPNVFMLFSHHIFFLVFKH